MGSAASLSATLYGTKEYYVREFQKGDPTAKKYVDELPVPSFGRAKFNKHQLDVLKIISENSYEIEGGSKELVRKKIGSSTTRKKLLQKLNWGEKGSTRLLGITNRLEKAGLINKIPNAQ